MGKGEGRQTGREEIYEGKGKEIREGGKMGKEKGRKGRRKG